MEGATGSWESNGSSEGNDSSGGFISGGAMAGSGSKEGGKSSMLDDFFFFNYDLKQRGPEDLEYQLCQLKMIGSTPLDHDYDHDQLF